MSQKRLAHWERRLLLCIESGIRSNPRRFYDAGTWLDDFYDVDRFWQRRQKEYEDLKTANASRETDETARYKLQYFELMMQMKVYLPLDSDLFRAGVAFASDHPLARAASVIAPGKQRADVPPDVARQLKMDDGEFMKYLLEVIPDFKDAGISLGGAAYLLEKVVWMAAPPPNPPLTVAEEILRKWGEMTAGEPAVRHRFEDAMESLLWKCWSKDFLTPEDAKRISLVVWLLSDPHAHELRTGLSRFGDWPWEQGHMGRSYVYYDTFMWDMEARKRWMLLAQLAHEVLRMEGECATADGTNIRNPGDAEHPPNSWQPPEGYIGTKRITHEKGVPRTTLEGWQERDTRQGRLQGVVKDPQTGENYYPQEWLKERLKAYRPRNRERAH